ncbi:MAG: GNAT family N-acetyltransferase [Erysipelotrichaceae bacterium]
MIIKKLNIKEIHDALPLVWKVFCEFEAINYPENDKRSFYNAIYSEEYIKLLTAYGAYDNNKLIGIIATRNNGSHIALFFVDGAYHNRGIGRNLWDKVLEESSVDKITVNSSLYAVEVYKKLGFKATDEVKCDGGIRYIPMEFKR